MQVKSSLLIAFKVIRRAARTDGQAYDRLTIACMRQEHCEITNLSLFEDDCDDRTGLSYNVARVTSSIRTGLLQTNPPGNAYMLYLLCSASDPRVASTNGPMVLVKVLLSQHAYGWAVRCFDRVQVRYEASANWLPRSFPVARWKATAHKRLHVWARLPVQVMPSSRRKPLLASIGVDSRC